MDKHLTKYNCKTLEFQLLRLWNFIFSTTNRKRVKDNKTKDKSSVKKIYCLAKIFCNSKSEYYIRWPTSIMNNCICGLNRIKCQWTMKETARLEQTLAVNKLQCSGLQKHKMHKCTNFYKIWKAKQTYLSVQGTGTHNVGVFVHFTVRGWGCKHH